MSFETAFEYTLRREGGYQLHTVKGDRGGMTYAGIARNAHPDWIGWNDIDKGDEPAAAIVRNFYKTRYWDKINGDGLPEPVAGLVFDCSVNMGVKNAIKLAQIAVGTTPDGIMGPKTIEAIRAQDSTLFVAKYSLARIARYVGIVERDRQQGKFLLGWIKRVLV